MRIGKKRHYVRVEKPITTQTASGAEEKEFVLAVRTWAEVTPLTTRQRERLAGNQVLADMDTTISMRWTPTLDEMDATWRVVYKRKVYNIVGVANIDERNRELEALCKVGMNNGQ